MEASRKTVLIFILIYFIYGVMSFFQFQAFVVPIVASEIFVGILAIVLATLNFKKDKKLYFYLIVFGLASLLFAPTILEIFLNQAEHIRFNDELSDIVALIELIFLTILLFYLGFQRIQKKIQVSLVPILVIVGIWTASFTGVIWLHQLCLALFAIILFWVEFNSKDDKKELLPTFALNLFFIGMGGIVGLDLLTIFLNDGIN